MIPYDHLQRVSVHIADMPVRRTYCGIDLIKGFPPSTVDDEEAYYELDEHIKAISFYYPGEEAWIELLEPSMPPIMCEACLGEAIGLPLREYKIKGVFRSRDNIEDHRPGAKRRVNERSAEGSIDVPSGP